MCCPVGPLVADLQPWVSCRCKIKRICPFYLHPGVGAVSFFNRTSVQHARAVACGAVCSARPKALGSREIQAFSSGAWCSHQGDSRCRQWVLDLATLECNIAQTAVGEGLVSPNISFVFVSLK